MRKRLKIIAASQDAGGCNAIYPVLIRLRCDGNDVAVFAAKYSVEILKGKDIPFFEIVPEDFNKVNKLFDQHKPDIALLGTSMGYSLEDVFLQECRKRGIPSVAVLDSWVNYSMRFPNLLTERKLEYLPDILCVMDDFAKREMVGEGIPEERIRVTGSPYFDVFSESISSYAPEKKNVLLKKWNLPQDARVISFISQAIDQTFGRSQNESNYLGYLQFDALELLMEALKKITKYHNYHLFLLVRPHPKEQKSSYQQFSIKDRNFSMIVSNEEDAEDILAVSDVVTGMFSTMLTLAYFIGKDIVSIQPHLSQEDPFILSRRGLIKTAVSLEDVIQHLEQLLAENRRTRPRLEAYQARGAIANITGIIEEINLATKKRE